MGKTKDKIRVSFIGGNAQDVTGSMTLIESPNFKVLIETGLFQSNCLKTDWQINSRSFNFKPSEIDYIFINHCHADHMLLLPRLVKEGFHGRIIVPKGTSKLFEVMGLDCAFIMSKDVETLTRKYNMNVPPIYTNDDVIDALQYFEEYESDIKIDLDDYITFRFVGSGHLILAQQLELWLKNNNNISKILYTSDLGNLSTSNYYNTTFKPVDKANLVIAESTYNTLERTVSGKKDRENDLAKIKCVIETVCIENKNKVLIPIFSNGRCQNILTILYDLFGKDENFNIPILIDSPLACKICDLYFDLLEGEQLEKYKEVMAWKNIRFVREYADSKAYQESNEPLCVLSASGFMSAGRSKTWASKLLPNSNAHILYVGYSSLNSLASKIKNGKKQKTITIDGKAIPNRCNVTDLKSFSGHIQYNDSLKYYSDINCEKIALVHGEFKGKCEYAKTLQEEVYKKNKTSKVICVNKSTEILL